MQIGIAGLGAALVPALAGVLARRTSIEVIPVFLLVLSLGVLALHAAGPLAPCRQARHPVKVWWSGFAVGWAIGAVASAAPLHGDGRGFESLIAHQLSTDLHRC
jgi:MFS-type transporter involved in bile tolerance (Atg22 family)